MQIRILIIYERVTKICLRSFYLQIIFLKQTENKLNIFHS